MTPPQTLKKNTMPAPVITNPYSADKKLTAYLNEPFSVKLAVSNPPVRIYTREDWVGWAYRWLEAESKVELLVTPRRILTDEVGILLGATNSDGFDETRIPYAFISRIPVISDIPDQKWAKGQQDIEFIIPIQHQVNIVSVRGDHIGLGFDPATNGIRISGDLIDGELLKDRGSFTVSAANATGIATPKTGNWRVYPQPSAVRNLTATSTLAGIVTLDWDAPADNGGFTINNYYYRVGDGEDAAWVDLKSANTEITFSDAFEAGTYIFYVRPVNSEGIIGKVGFVSHTVKRVDPPTIESIDDIEKDIGYTAFTIQASLESGTPGTWSIQGTGASISTTGLITIAAGNADGSYDYTVTHTNEAGSDTEDFSMTVSVTVPEGISGLSASVVGTRITWTWTAPTGDADVDGYRIGGNGSGTTTATSYSLTGSKGRTYSITVTPYNSHGNGPTSAAVSATIPATVPGPVRNLIRNARTGYINWDPPLDNGGSLLLYYEYSFNGGAWTRTTVAYPYVAGLNTYTVRAVNAIGAGPTRSISWSNATAPQWPAQRTWVVSNTALRTTPHLIFNLGVLPSGTRPFTYTVVNGGSLFDTRYWYSGSTHIGFQVYTTGSIAHLRGFTSTVAQITARNSAGSATYSIRISFT